MLEFTKDTLDYLDQGVQNCGVHFKGETLSPSMYDISDGIGHSPSEQIYRILNYQDNELTTLRTTCQVLKEMLIHNSEEYDFKINTMKEELRVMKNRLNRMALGNNCKK